MLKRSHRAVARALDMGMGTVSECLTRATAAGIADFAAVEVLDDDALKAKLYPPTKVGQRPLPAPAYIAKELLRPGVTLRLLDEEYLMHW